MEMLTYFLALVDVALIAFAFYQAKKNSN